MKGDEPATEHPALGVLLSASEWESVCSAKPKGPSRLGRPAGQARQGRAEVVTGVLGGVLARHPAVEPRPLFLGAVLKIDRTIG